MNMNDINKFIKDNSEYINLNMYKELYEEAYEWLSNEQTSKLTDILSTALHIDAERYAREVIIEKFTLELQNFKASTYESLTLASFIRLFMNHLNGLNYHEFSDLVSFHLTSYPQSGIEIFEDESDLNIKQVY